MKIETSLDIYHDGLESDYAEQQNENKQWIAVDDLIKAIDELYSHGHCYDSVCVKSNDDNLICVYELKAKLGLDNCKRGS